MTKETKLYQDKNKVKVALPSAESTDRLAEIKATPWVERDERDWDAVFEEVEALRERLELILRDPPHLAHGHARKALESNPCKTAPVAGE